MFSPRPSGSRSARPFGPGVKQWNDQMLRPILDIAVHRQGVHSRRGFLRNLAAGVSAGTLALGWRDLLQAQAAELRKRGKALILLWMDGGPSQYDTFTPKIGSEYQGPATAIETRIPGVQFAHYWPET